MSLPEASMLQNPRLLGDGAIVAPANDLTSNEKAPRLTQREARRTNWR